MNRRHVDMYHLFKNELKDLARRIAFFGVNYRDFLVGCAILAYDGFEYRIFVGYNIMTKKGGPKRCAECDALEAVRAAGFDLIVVLPRIGNMINRR